jgi:HEAT repeats
MSAFGQTRQLQRKQQKSPKNSELVQFEASAHEITSRNNGQLWECETIFHDLLTSGFAVNLVNQELGKMARDVGYVPPFGLSQSDLRLIQTPSFSLLLRIQEAYYPPPNYLYSGTSDNIVGVLDCNAVNGITFECFEQPESNRTLERPKKLVRGPNRVADRGDTIRIRAGIDVYQLLPPGHLTLLLTMQSESRLSTFWEYDSSTLLPVRAIAASSSLSRLEFAARMLSEFGDPSSIPVLSDLINHPEHFIRWAAIRAIARIDETEGVKALYAAQNDQHPHVRRAALRELKQISHDQSSIGEPRSHS